MDLIKMNLQLFADEDTGSDTGATSDVADTQTDTSNADNTNADNLNTGASDNDSVVADTKSKQSPEVDSAFAEMRRKAETAEREATQAKEQLKRDREIASKYGKDYGVYNEEDISKLYGVHGIHTVDDLQRAILNEEYKEKGIDPDQINQLIENHPLIQEAKKVKENTVISNQYNALMADLKDEGLGDMVKKPDDVPDSVYQRWDFGNNKGGLSLSECFFLERRKEIAVKKVEATKQSTLNNLAGKQHLKTEGDGAADANDTSIPQETLAMYLDMGMDKKQAMAHYKKIYGG
jgi:hypothetical protein